MLTLVRGYCHQCHAWRLGVGVAMRHQHTYHGVRLGVVLVSLAALAMLCTSLLVFQFVLILALPITLLLIVTWADDESRQTDPHCPVCGSPVLLNHVERVRQEPPPATVRPAPPQRPSIDEARVVDEYLR
jgi:hypothetical protein